MCGTTLAGCGGGDTDNSAKNKSDSQTSAEPKEVDADGKIDGLMYAEGLPIVDEGTYSFSIFCDDSSATGEFYMMDELKKQTNVDVELQLNAYENATEKMNLALNSGSYADVIGGWILTDAMILTYGVEQGVHRHNLQVLFRTPLLSRALPLTFSSYIYPPYYKILAFCNRRLDID